MNAQCADDAGANVLDAEAGKWESLALAAENEAARER